MESMEILSSQPFEIYELPPFGLSEVKSVSYLNDLQ